MRRNTKGRKRELIAILLGVTSTYGPQFVHRNDVAASVSLALRLAEGENYEEQVGRLILESISLFPSGQVTNYLKRLNLEDHPTWLSTALSALRMDPRPGFQDLDHEDHEILLRKIAERQGMKLLQSSQI